MVNHTLKYIAISTSNRYIHNNFILGNVEDFNINEEVQPMNMIKSIGINVYIAMVSFMSAKYIDVNTKKYKNDINVKNNNENNNKIKRMGWGAYKFKKISFLSKFINFVTFIKGKLRPKVHASSTNDPYLVHVITTDM